MYTESDTRDVDGAPSHPFVARDPILVLVASTEVHQGAWTAKRLLQSEGIQAFLGGHALSPSERLTDLYVLDDDLNAAKRILQRSKLWHASTWVT